MPPIRTLDRGTMTHVGRRGEVLGHPGTADAFRRRLARLGADCADIREPAAALLDLANRLLRPGDARDRSGSPAPAAARANS